MEGTAAPISFSSSLRIWLGKLEQGRVWLDMTSSHGLLDRVYRAYADGVRRAGSGSLPLARWLWAGRDEALASITGLVIVGQLRKGRAGASDAPWLPAPLGYRDVRVDRRGSGVGNPFKAGDSTPACLAFDLLMTLALLQSCTEDTTTRAAGADGALSHAVAGTMERILLRRISARYLVCLAPTADAFSLARLSAWLHTHAQLVAGGQRLRLLCWCCDDASCARPGSIPCHARSLAVILLWMACHLNEGLLSEQRTAASESMTDDSSVQVPTCPTLYFGADSHPSLSMLAAWLHASHILRRGVATPGQTSHMRGCPVPQGTAPRPGRLISNAS